MFYILYDVKNIGNDQQAGPYTEDEVIFQFNDIIGFEGIINAQIVSVDKIDSIKQNRMIERHDIRSIQP